MKLIGKKFRVTWYPESAIIDGELDIDLYKDKDFLVHSQAVAFGKAHCDVSGATSIEQIDIYDDHGIDREEYSGDQWECTQTECYRVAEAN